MADRKPVLTTKPGLSSNPVILEKLPISKAYKQTPNERQFLFAMFFTDYSDEKNYQNKIQAAKSAGYKGNNKVLSTTCTRLLRNPIVIAEMDLLKDRQLSKIDVKQAELVRELRNYAGIGLKRKVVENRDRIKSIELLGKTLRMFGDTLDVNHGFQGYDPPEKSDYMAISEGKRKAVQAQIVGESGEKQGSNGMAPDEIVQQD